MKTRQNDFLHKLCQNYTTLAQAEERIDSLKREISISSMDTMMLPNLSLQAALDELEATEEYVFAIRKNMNTEESWTK